MNLQTIKRLPVVRTLYRLGWLVSAYHLTLAFLGALRYGFPSRKLVVIGVTGTKGKTTTCDLIAQILNAAGRETGLVTTVNFSTGDREWVNDTKQTMPGRFTLQRLLREMVRSGCTHAVVETSSEGILQHRHRFISYRVAVFTNLSPEHIERHGSFEAYRAAKVTLFERVAKRKDGVGVYNLDDENVGYFLAPPVPVKYGYTRRAEDRGQRKEEGGKEIPNYKHQITNNFRISNIKLTKKGTAFAFAGEKLEMPLVGEFNVANAAAAICVALSQGIPVGRIGAALRAAKPVPGRLELVNVGQRFTIIVDYAHEPASLAAVYEAARLFEPRRVIGLLGSQGGGRDVWKRAEMGKIAARNCDEIVLTNEDPYDEDPVRIINDIEKGIRVNPRFDQRRSASIHKTVDRREAIRTALSLARPGDAVVLTGKGGEVWMCVAGGRKIPWDEKKTVEEEIKKLSGK